MGGELQGNIGEEIPGEGEEGRWVRWEPRGYRVSAEENALGKGGWRQEGISQYCPMGTMNWGRVVVGEWRISPDTAKGVGAAWRRSYGVLKNLNRDKTLHRRQVT